MSMKPLFSRHSRKSRAQSMVEFALTMPILLLVISGVLELANLLAGYNRIQAASREGARIAAAGGTDGVISDTVQASMEGSLDPGTGFLEIWVVRPTVAISGTTWSWKGTGGTWGGADEACVYPLDTDGNAHCANTSSGINPTTVLNNLKAIYGGTTTEA